MIRETPSPMLYLLERLANAWLQAAPAGGDVRVVQVRLKGDALELEVQISGKGQLVDGKYPLRLAVESTSPERTLLSLDLPATKGLGKLMNLGLKAMAGPMVNAWLDRHFSGAVSLESERVVVNHQAALARLLARGGDTRPG